MSAPCPHPSPPDAAGYCPVCGIDLPSGAASPSPPVSPSSSVSPAPGHCAGCGARRAGGRFCEACGLRDGGPGAARPPAGWTATVTRDRDLFLASGAGDEGVEFPGEARRDLALTATELVIGRRTRRRQQAPDLDLSGPPPDLAASRWHARLYWQDGGWSVVDLGSANGTFVNGATTPIPPHESVILASGDRIDLGLWTRITIAHPG